MAPRRWTVLSLLWIQEPHHFISTPLHTMTLLDSIYNAWNGLQNPYTGTGGSLPVPVAEPVGNSYTFADMRGIVAAHDPSVVLVDVREPSEYSVVSIPGSINVPWKTHPEGFELPEDQFKAAFGVAKPQRSQELVFYCASGMRAAKARSVAFNHGYPKTSIYKGSMNDWVANGGDKLDL